MELYKLYYIDSDTTATEVFDKIEILTQDQLSARLKQAITEGQLNDETMKNFSLNKDTDTDELDACDILDIFDYDGYAVEQIEIETETDEYYY